MVDFIVLFRDARGIPCPGELCDAGVGELFGVFRAYAGELFGVRQFAKHTKTVEDTLVIETTLHGFAAGREVNAGIWYQDELVGTIGLHINRSNQSASIGYWIGRAYEGRGIMTRSCRALITYAFGELALHRIEIRANMDNIRSRALATRVKVGSFGEETGTSTQSPCGIWAAARSQSLRQNGVGPLEAGGQELRRSLLAVLLALAQVPSWPSRSFPDMVPLTTFEFLAPIGEIPESRVRRSFGAFVKSSSDRPIPQTPTLSCIMRTKCSRP